MTEKKTDFTCDYTVSELFEQAMHDENWKKDAIVRERLVKGFAKKIYNLN